MSLMDFTWSVFKQQAFDVIPLFTIDCVARGELAGWEQDKEKSITTREIPVENYCWHWVEAEIWLNNNFVMTA